MTIFKFIAVNNDHGWGKGATLYEARRNALRNGPKATFTRVWEIADGKGEESYVDGMGSVYGIKPDTVRDFRRASASIPRWIEAEYDPEA